MDHDQRMDAATGKFGDFVDKIVGVVGPDDAGVKQSGSKVISEMLENFLLAHSNKRPKPAVEMCNGGGPQIVPRADQVKAVEEIVEGFRKHDRGQLIRACGTGKTLVGAWAAKEMNVRRVLILVPTLDLIAQTVKAWRLSRAFPIMNVLAVCSNADRTQSADGVLRDVADAQLNHTTDAESIAEFLRAPIDGLQLLIGTYHSSRRVAEAMSRRDIPMFDLAIADEAHRVASAAAEVAGREFQTILDARHIRAAKRLFMTATPRTYRTLAKARAAANGVELASMDDESMFGPVLSKLSFAEAMRVRGDDGRAVLCDYQIVIFVTSDQELLEEVQRQSGRDRSPTTLLRLAAHIGLAKAMAEHQLNRAILYH